MPCGLAERPPHQFNGTNAETIRVTVPGGLVVAGSRGQQGAHGVGTANHCIFEKSELDIPKREAVRIMKNSLV
jgi:hypothetical protein